MHVVMGLFMLFLIFGLPIIIGEQIRKKKYGEKVKCRQCERYVWPDDVSYYQDTGELSGERTGHIEPFCKTCANNRVIL